MPVMGTATKIFPRLGSAPYSGEVPEDFGPLLRQRLKDRGLTLRGFAAIIGKPISTISRVSQGVRSPNPTWLKTWGKALGYSGAELEHFIDLGRSARAKAKSDSSNHITELESEIEESETTLALGGMIITRLIEFLAKKGIKPDDDLQKLIAQFQEAL